MYPTHQYINHHDSGQSAMIYPPAYLPPRAQALPPPQGEFIVLNRNDGQRESRLASPPRQEQLEVGRRGIPKLDGPIVTINLYYGDDESKRVFVHKSYLCKYSKYFRAALNTPAFAETESQEVDLEEMSTKPFDSFIHWVYHRSVPSFETANLQQLKDLLELWIFADKYIVPNLQNHVMVEMIRILDDIVMRADHTTNFGAIASRHPNNALFEYVYKNTTDGSRLRHVLADWLAVSFRGINADSLPLEMVRDVFKSVQQLPDEGGFICRDNGYYFVNEDID